MVSFGRNWSIQQATSDRSFTSNLRQTFLDSNKDCYGLCHFIGFLKPTYYFATCVFRARNADSVCEHTVSVSTCFELPDWLDSFQINSNIESRCRKRRNHGELLGPPQAHIPFLGGEIDIVTEEQNCFQMFIKNGSQNGFWPTKHFIDRTLDIVSAGWIAMDSP